MEYKFTPRSELSAFEWNPEQQHWNRLTLDPQTLKELSKRSNLHGILRVILYAAIMIALAAAAIYVSRINFLLAIPIIYIYYFFYGFLIALAHELQHKIVFDKSLDGFSEIVYQIVQTLVWNSARYARISHRLHHRYTMIHGLDPETPWPDVVSTKWLRRYLMTIILNIFVVGAPYALFKDIKLNVERVFGKKDRMMQDHCTPADLLAIRIESLGILIFHAAVVAVSVYFRRWEPIIFITIAWQIGASIENLWHSTEHIGRLYNVNDFRLCTRSIRVSPFTHLIFGGLDDHVDHHIFPGVPSKNLPRLHKILKKDLAPHGNVIQCWKEMFAIAKAKDKNPDHEYVPVDIA